jgi:hypothetical protein
VVTEKPSILSQVEQVIDEQAIDGVTAGVIVKDGAVGAEVSAKVDPGNKGGWTFGAVARVVKGKDRFAAILAKWSK